MLDWLIPAAYAQTSAPGGAQGMILSNINFILIPLMIGVFYFLIIRPQSRRAKEQRDMLGQLARGDEVVISGGLAGKIANIGETYLTLEVAEKVEVKVQKSAITAVLPKGSLKNL